MVHKNIISLLIEGLKKNIQKGYDFTKKNISESSRIIDRSLRTIVKKEAEIVNLPLSKEEKNIELIAKQQ